MDDDSFFGMLKAVFLRPFHYVVFFVTILLCILGLKTLGLLRPRDWNSPVNFILFVAFCFGIIGVSWVAGALATHLMRQKWGRAG